MAVQTLPVARAVPASREDRDAPVAPRPRGAIAALVVLRAGAAEPAFVYAMAALLDFVAGPRFAVLRCADLRRLFEMEGRVAAGRLAGGARPELPRQRRPGPRLGSGLVLFLVGLVSL